MYVYLDPPPLPRVSIGLDRCVSPTSQAPHIEGGSWGTNLKSMLLSIFGIR